MIEMLEENESRLGSLPAVRKRWQKIREKLTGDYNGVTRISIL